MLFHIARCFYSDGISEEHPGNMTKRRLLVNPYGPEFFKLKFAVFLETQKLPVPVLKGKNVAKIQHQYW